MLARSAGPIVAVNPPPNLLDHFRRRSRQLLADAIQPATAARYARHQALYKQFTRAICIDRGLPHSTHFPPYPTSDLLTSFTAYLFDRHNYSGQTIKAVIAGVRHTTIASGAPDPLQDPATARLLANITRGVDIALGRTAGAERSTSTPRAAISADILRRLTTVQPPGISAELHTCFLLAARVAFMAGLRLGELLPTTEKSWSPARHPTPSRLRLLPPSPDQPLTYELLLPISKTDREQRGTTVFLSQVEGPLDPVSAMQDWLTSHPTTQNGPIFLADGRPLTKRRFISTMRACMSAAGIENPQQYAGHSLRKGLASSLHNGGYDAEVIKNFGRWRSDAFRRYCHLSLGNIQHAQQTLSASSHQFV